MAATIKTMVPLIGSEKQVAWAEDIRSEILPQAEALLAKQREQLAKFVGQGDERKIAIGRKGVANREATLQALQTIPHAKWWIDQRGRSAQHVGEKAGLAAYKSWVSHEVASILDDEQKYFDEVRRVYPSATDEELRA